MRRDTTTLTTGEAAKMIGVNLHTIAKALDNGEIKGFKIPGGSHRRILKSDFYRYCEERNIPIKENQTTC